MNDAADLASLDEHQLRSLAAELMQQLHVRDEQIRALTLEQVNAAFRKWIDPKKALTVGAGSFSAARAKSTEKVQK